MASAALFAAMFALHCGGREGTLRNVTAPVTSGSTASSSSPRTEGDPLCGEGWKWDGTRCTQTDLLAVGADGRKEPPPPKGGANGGEGAGAGGGDEPSRASSLQSGGGVGTAQLVVRDVTVGTGAEAKAGDNVRIHYVGTLADGTEFDSSRKRGIPFEFRLGSGQVIKGFDRGILGMKVGGMRQLTIPPELGYGRKGAPPLIPPRATLVFEIELLDVT
jgi:hypothetical protein